MFSLHAPDFFRRALFFRSGAQNFFAEDFFLVQKRRFFSASHFVGVTYADFDLNRRFAKREEGKLLELTIKFPLPDHVLEHPKPSQFS